MNLVLVLVVVFVGLAFHIKNDAPISLNYYLGTAELPLSWVVVAALLLGVLLGAVVTSFSILRLKMEIRGLRREKETASREIANLRAIPINDAS
ncbi:MAG: LapA family protein [Gammaproteobacteria bacterium]|nr:LapA family protein [Gammaproteobacteria bacterium]